MALFYDIKDYGNEGRKPLRIVSLVPSQTELLYDLGLEDEVVGITKFCVHPVQWFHGKTRVGGTKTVDVDKVIALNPDLVIANHEENVKEQVEALAERLPVYVTDVANLDDALNMVRSVGTLCGKASRGLALAAEIEAAFGRIKPPDKPAIVAYFIWQQPWMVAGGDTFISDMLRRLGFINVFGHLNRYPTIEESIISEHPPEFILLSSEPFPFGQKHIEAWQALVPSAKVLLVDGEMFSWYGSRLKFSADYFVEWLAQIRG